MSMNNQGRPTSVDGIDTRRRTVAPGTVTPEELPTISGDRGLDHEEKLIFELDHGAVGVDCAKVENGLGQIKANRGNLHCGRCFAWFASATARCVRGWAVFRKADRAVSIDDLTRSLELDAGAPTPPLSSSNKSLRVPRRRHRGGLDRDSPPRCRD